MNVTVTSDKHQQPVPFKNFASITNSSATSKNRYDYFAKDRDVGSVASEITDHINAINRSLPPDYLIAIRGEIQSMKESFSDLRLGFTWR